MTDDLLQKLQSITSPFANTSDHVQGPGGNTSVKEDGQILIKASGFTFKDVANNNGIVLLNNQAIVDNLYSKVDFSDTILENTPPEIVESVPAGLKPSMEFEFHSILKTYVLHTHSVYANIVACATNCGDLLSQMFTADEYVLVPYVTPGFPIAASLLKNNQADDIPSIIFLKNHGIIIHGDDYSEVLKTYKKVQDKIVSHFNLKLMEELTLIEGDGETYTIDADGLEKYSINLETAEVDLMNEVLIPDQSIFFRNRISSTDTEKEIFIDLSNHQIVIIGSQKFIAAAKAMLQAVYYIKNNIKKAGLKPDYISEDKIAEMHGLSTEKYRTQILKDKA